MRRTFPSAGPSSARGITLIELLAGMVILTVVAALASLTLPDIIRTLTEGRARMGASFLASSKMQELKNQPYGYLTPTPSRLLEHTGISTLNFGQQDLSFFDTQPDNSAAVEKIATGTMEYTRRVCVNAIEPDPGSPTGWKSHCPESGQDPGLKNVVVEVAFPSRGTHKTVRMESLVSRGTGQTVLPFTGQFEIQVCRAKEPIPANADPNDPAQVCDSGRDSEVYRSEVSVYKNEFINHNSGQSPTAAVPVVRLEVPADAGYEIHVQKEGFFPFHLSNQAVGAARTVKVLAPLRHQTFYQSTLAGEVFVADHPVIAKVIGQVSKKMGNVPGGDPSCADDLREALEIYNPTSSTFSFKTGGNLKLRFYKGSVLIEEVDFSNEAVYKTPLPGASPVKAQGDSFLIIGTDDPFGSINPSAIVPDQPDFRYDPSRNLIPVEGGGIRLLQKNSATGQWQVIDSVRWIGYDGSAAPADNLEGVAWEGPPMPAGSIKFEECYGPS